MPSSEGHQERFSLVGLDGVSHFGHFDVDIAILLQRYVDFFSIYCRFKEPFILFCGSHSLPCMLHVSFWSFLQFGVILVVGFDSNSWLCGVIIKPDGFEPCLLCCGSSARGEVPNDLFRDGYIIEAVDGFSRVWSVE